MISFVRQYRLYNQNIYDVVYRDKQGKKTCVKTFYSKETLPRTVKEFIKEAICEEQYDRFNVLEKIYTY